MTAIGNFHQVNDATIMALPGQLWPLKRRQRPFVRTSVEPLSSTPFETFMPAPTAGRVAQEAVIRVVMLATGSRQFVPIVAALLLKEVYTERELTAVVEPPTAKVCC
jgi:hypothetical protein